MWRMLALAGICLVSGVFIAMLLIYAALELELFSDSHPFMDLQVAP